MVRAEYKKKKTYVEFLIGGVPPGEMGGWNPIWLNHPYTSELGLSRNRRGSTEAEVEGKLPWKTNTALFFPPVLIKVGPRHFNPMAGNQRRLRIFQNAEKRQKETKQK